VPVNLLDQILDTADALTEPHMHTEPITYWDTNRHRKTRRHTTIQPGLLAQLYQSVIPASSSTEASAGGTFGSRPPLAVEALSRHDQIAMAVLRWCTSMGLPTRASVESNIRALVGAVGHLDDDTTAALLTEMRQWRRWAAVLTGWENLLRPAGVPCPIVDCGKTNTLRINLTTKTGMCQACGATWSEDDGGISILADHVRLQSNRAAA
jgi:hypothetical protein